MSAFKYLAGKALTILITIFIGVFVTLLIVNYPGGQFNGERFSPFESNLERQIHSIVQISTYNGIISRDPNGNPIQSEVDALEARLRSEAGLDLSFFPRHLLWTSKALMFDWGELNSSFVPPLRVGQIFPTPTENYVLEYLPNTLLLVGTAYLLVFLIGMPFALYLTRSYGGRLDRVMSALSPISSVPSWVFAMLLVTIFAVQLRWLPAARMFDFHKPTEPIPYLLTLARHMILPVSALVLSLLFQLVYTWRSFLVIYSEEDYVDLARAKGLEPRLLEKQYILRPALPYVITSFATSLIGFWQLTVVLERIFQWPGIGLLYIEALPNYWDETIQYGDLMVVIQIVVAFSYLLGILVFLMDITYVIVDPRIHLVPQSNLAQTSARLKANNKRWNLPFTTWMKRKGSGRAKPAASPMRKREFSWEKFVSRVRRSLHDLNAQLRFFFQEFRAYPSAMFGLIVITFLLAGSLYALIALPYEQFGREYGENRAQGRNYAPRLAAPAWLNLFSSKPRLSALLLDENSKLASASLQTLENGWVEKTVTFKFDYGYKEMPSDVFLYLDPQYSQKLPFVSFIWTTPDGRTIDLKATNLSGDTNYDFETGISVARVLNQNAEWKNWFVTEGQYPTPAFKLLFAMPDSTQPTPQPGTYQLEIKGLLFEEDSNLHPQLVLLGQVYGVAGTDYWRRDLIVPLFWGMPFTLIVGFVGALVTTLIAMLLPAIGVWFGGWLDSIVQRLTEVSMVLPGLALVVLANALFGIHIWILLGIIVLLNALGAPIKTFRAALLQAKEAPYIEMARAYGASNFRIITRYLVPRILPIFIPQLITQIPSFIFLEATLGFFNIKSNYPTWGRIIYDGLARGALYGSPFWVLEPIFLLLLTGLAFAMLGAALERILNPRIISDIPVETSKLKLEVDEAESHPRKGVAFSSNNRFIASLVVALLVSAVFVPFIQGKSLASVLMSYIDRSRNANPPRQMRPSASVTDIPSPSVVPTSTLVPASPTEPLTTRTPTATSSSILTPTAALVTIEPTLMPSLTSSLPPTYTLQKGEYPYCIARRFNVDPRELLTLNGVSNRQEFYTGTVLQIPQNGNPFPGERRLKAHPTSYIVSAANETLYTIACQFGDINPLTIAQVNDVSVDFPLFVGQQLNIP